MPFALHFWGLKVTAAAESIGADDEAGPPFAFCVALRSAADLRCPLRNNPEKVIHCYASGSFPRLPISNRG